VEDGKVCCAGGLGDCWVDFDRNWLLACDAAQCGR